MSKSVSELALQNMFMDFTGYMEDARNQMFKIHNPLEYTFDTLFRLSEFTGNAIDQFVRHHTDTLDFYLPTPTEQKTDQPFNKFTAVKPGRIETGYVAVVTGGIGGIGSEICKRLYTDGHQVIATYISFEKDLAKPGRQTAEKKDTKSISLNVMLPISNPAKRWVKTGV
jgi:3-oxoacyl-ACP reductase-like protein